MNITFEERQLMSLYNTGTRTGLIAALEEMRGYQKVQHKILWHGVLLSRLESLQNPCADPPHDCRGRKACNLLNILYGKQV